MIADWVCRRIACARLDARQREQLWKLVSLLAYNNDLDPLYEAAARPVVLGGGAAFGEDFLEHFLDFFHEAAESGSIAGGDNHSVGKLAG